MNDSAMPTERETPAEARDRLRHDILEARYRQFTEEWQLAVLNVGTFLGLAVISRPVLNKLGIQTRWKRIGTVILANEVRRVAVSPGYREDLAVKWGEISTQVRTIRAARARQ
jgi:hypothetical protein